MKTDSTLRIAVAGATGFVGMELLARFKEDPRITGVYALTRSNRKSEIKEKIVSRTADIGDYEATQNALRGADVAIYLVHSMAPQARMSQGAFEDFDLYQADHFVRAAESAGVKKIFYLGGIILEASPELTAFRAGLILGQSGSSSQMLISLVQRLPIMVQKPHAFRTHSS